MSLENINKRRIINSWLLFNGPGIYWIVPVSAFHITYGINEIPTGEVKVPLGRDAFSGNISPAYALFSQFFYRIPTYLFITIANDDTHPYSRHLATGTYFVFAGFVIAANVRASFGNHHLILRVAHWLADLNNSSSLSASSHPNNPSSTIYDPTLVYGLSTFPALSLKGLTTALVPDFNKALNDFWTGAIYPFLNFLASTDRINTMVFKGQGEASAAWVRRILYFFQMSRLKLNSAVLGGYAGYVLYHMISQLLGIFDQHPSEGETTNILQSLLNDVFIESLAKTTLWQKMVGLANEFNFMIIPYPLFYQIVPKTAGSQAAYDPYARGITITPDEIIDVETAFMPPPIPLRAMCVYTGLPFHAGSALDPNNNALQNATDFGGVYLTIPDIGFGRIEIIRVPDYLATPYEPSIYMRAAAGLYDGKIHTLRKPKAKKTTLEIQQLALKNHKISFLDSVAHAAFVETQLKGRRAVIRCPFRGDIAPGSSINYIPDNSNFLPTGIPNIFYGLVTSVEYVCDNEGSPTTRYTVDFVRNYTENLNPNFSVSYNYLYDPYWIGGPHLLVG